MGDVFALAYAPSSRLTFGVALTTGLCSEAQRLHELSTVPTVALGRLLTSVALTHHVQVSDGGLSFQIVCEGPLRQVFADCTEQGALRGYVGHNQLAFPDYVKGSLEARTSIGFAIGSGSLTAIKADDNAGFSQSTVALASSEVDEDVESFLNESEQIQTALRAHTVLDEHGIVASAGGLIVQAMPDSDSAMFEAAVLRMRDDDHYAALLRDHQREPEAVLAEWAPDAEIRELSPLRWECRCSAERVLGALKMLDPLDLADMVNEGEHASVRCEFCRAVYDVSPSEIEAVYSQIVVGRA